MPKTPSKPKKATPQPEDSQALENQGNDLPDPANSPAVVPPDAEEMNDLQLVLKTKVKLDDTSLTLAGDTTFEEWREVYAFADKLNERGKFWLGDIVHYAEGKFPDRYTQAIEMTGLSYSRLTTLVSVCSRVEPARRRKEAPFHWHEKIAYLPYQTGDHLLDRAIKEKWTSEQLADAVARAKGEPTAAEKRAAKEAKPGSTAAKVAASGKTPQVPEGEKPLIWNGYPLRVGKPYEGANERIVFQGNEPLQEGETERAAHENKFAHKEAMMNWLEEHNFIKGGDEPCAQNTIKDASRPAAKDSATDASAPIVSASNGAAPNATESAPTPTPDPFEALLNQSAPEGQLWKCPDCDVFAILGGDAAFHVSHSKHRMPVLVATPFPAAPPASPEPPISDDIAKTMQAVIDGLQLDVKKLRADHEEEKAQMAAIMEEMGAHPASHNTGEKAMMEVKNIWQSIRIERDDARDQLLRYDAHTGAKTPLQRAEESLLAFAAASESVDWEEIGANKLLRQKWLERLLLPCDVVIDRIQAAAIKGKN